MESLGGRALVEADPDLGGGAAAAAAPLSMLLLSSLAVPIGTLSPFRVIVVEGVPVSIWSAASSALDRGQKVVHRGLVSAAVCGEIKGREK